MVHNSATEAEGYGTLNTAPYGINAKSIIAHLVVTEPDGAERRYQAPLDLYMHGCQYDESIWLTRKQPADDMQELHNEIYNACWDWEGSDNPQDEEEYPSKCQILQTYILENDEAAFIAEPRQLCDRFWPQSRSDRQTVTVSNDWHSLSWSRNGIVK